jgi:Myb-like DNA-binding protein REB1
MTVSTEFESVVTLINNVGKWSKDEEEQLTQAVKEISGQEGDIDRHVFWSKVSEVMEGKRNRQQCTQKWFVALSVSSKILVYAYSHDRKDSLHTTIKNNGDKKRWNATDSYTLVHRCAFFPIKRHH